jgi:hypothetical protein
MQAGEFKCCECGEEFEYQSHCAFHHLETKHQNFELISTDVNILIKS